MRAFRKDFIREITKNKGRFLSVFFIVLLGAAFFSGIRSAEGDMKVSADRYYDEEMKKLRKRYQREKEKICARYVAEEKAGYGA